MSRNIVALALAVALVGCVSAPPGVDAQKWSYDRQSCRSEAQFAGAQSAGLSDYFVDIYQRVGGTPATPSTLSWKWQKPLYEKCMLKAGYAGEQASASWAKPWNSAD